MTQLPLEPCLACRTGAHRACAATACPCRAGHGDTGTTQDPDPAVNAARALATAIAAFRDLLGDAAFADCLEHFEALRIAIPTAADLDVPAPRDAARDTGVPR